MVPLQARRIGTAVALVLWLVAVAACGGGDGRRAASGQGRIRVFAAASLTEAFGQAGEPVDYSFAGSQLLATQITQGAPADVFASADERSMRRLVDAGSVVGPVAFAHNRLQIAVGPGNPARIAGLADLARPGLRVVLADPGVPAGAYARQALERAAVAVEPVSLELDVKAEVAKVDSGDADAAIVYATDVRAAGSRLAGVAIPDDQNVTAVYEIGVVRTSTRRAAAARFVASAVSGRVHRALMAAGFEPA